MSNVDVEVRAGDCPCPGHPHDVETVTLEVGEDGGATLALSIYAYKMLANAEGTWQAKESALVASYIPKAIIAWSFEDEQGHMVDINRQNAERLIPWDKGGHVVMERANELYSNRIIAPFLPKPSLSSTQTASPSSQLSSGSSPTGPEESSTSPTQPSSSSPPVPLKRSSRNSSAG